MSCCMSFFPPFSLFPSFLPGFPAGRVPSRGPLSLPPVRVPLPPAQHGVPRGPRVQVQAHQVPLPHLPGEAALRQAHAAHPGKSFIKLKTSVREGFMEFMPRTSTTAPPGAGTASAGTTPTTSSPATSTSTRSPSSTRPPSTA